MSDLSQAQAADREKTLLTALLLSAPGPLVLGYAALAGNSTTQLADFVRRTIELVALFLSWWVFRRLQRDTSLSQGDQSRLEHAAGLGASLIHYSTDYVFNGSKGSPYIEADFPNPLGVYGSSKLAGERAISQIGGAYLILRTSWVYSTRRPSFVTKVLEWSRQQPALRMVTDQVANPTSARMLAEITALLLAKAAPHPTQWIEERAGIYHLAGSGIASRLEWAQDILELDPHPTEQITRKIVPALTADFPTPAQRPLYSALNCELFEQTFGLRLPDWPEALRLTLDKS